MYNELADQTIKTSRAFASYSKAWDAFIEADIAAHPAEYLAALTPIMERYPTTRAVWEQIMGGIKHDINPVLESFKAFADCFYDFAESRAPADVRELERIWLDMFRR